MGLSLESSLIGLSGIEIPNDLESTINSNHHWGFCLVGLILQVMGMGTHWDFVWNHWGLFKEN
jgi:hypothetical protein